MKNWFRLALTAILVVACMISKWISKWKKQLRETMILKDNPDKYTEEINLNPNNAVAYYNRGNAYQGLQQYNRAIQDYSKAIELNPNYVDAYLNRGLAYDEGLNQPERAIQDYDKVIQLNPNYTLAKNHRAACLKAMGR